MKNKYDTKKQKKNYIIMVEDKYVGCINFLEKNRDEIFSWSWFEDSKLAEPVTEMESINYARQLMNLHYKNVKRIYYDKSKTD